MDSYRKDFLLNMYSQMWLNINRHILVVWQSVTVLVTVIALFSAVHKEVLPLWLAEIIVVSVGTWAICHAYDAHVWYHRNLSIISNIEREFLGKSDLENISFFVERHREPEKILHHLKLQIFLCGWVGLLFYAQKNG